MEALGSSPARREKKKQREEEGLEEMAEYDMDMVTRINELRDSGLSLSEAREELKRSGM